MAGHIPRKVPAPRRPPDRRGWRPGPDRSRRGWPIPTRSSRPGPPLPPGRSSSPTAATHQESPWSWGVAKHIVGSWATSFLRGDGRSGPTVQLLPFEDDPSAPRPRHPVTALLTATAGGAFLYSIVSFVIWLLVMVWIYNIAKRKGRHALGVGDPRVLLLHPGVDRPAPAPLEADDRELLGSGGVHAWAGPFGGCSPRSRRTGVEWRGHPRIGPVGSVAHRPLD